MNRVAVFVAAFLGVALQAEASQDDYEVQSSKLASYTDGQNLVNLKQGQKLPKESQIKLSEDGELFFFDFSAGNDPIVRECFGPYSGLIEGCPTERAVKCTNLQRLTGCVGSGPTGGRGEP